MINRNEHNKPIYKISDDSDFIDHLYLAVTNILVQEYKIAQKVLISFSQNTIFPMMQWDF